jgi:hypothetical protein
MENDNARKLDSDRDEDDLSKEEIEALIRRTEDLQKDFKELEGWADRHFERQLRELAGPILDRILKNREETLKYLTDPNPRLRQAAVRLAYSHWNITDTLVTEYERMALTETDQDVRDAAIAALGTCYAGTKDSRVGQLLAGMVRDTKLSDGIRVTAFAYLIRVHGDPDYDGPSPSIPLHLEDIDWDFVEQYLSGKRDDGREEL